MKTASRYTHSQSGSAHVIVAVALVVALIGALGFIFWQNFVNKPAQPTTTSTAETKASVTPSPSLKSYCISSEKICFDYPADWVVVNEKIEGSTESAAQRMHISDQNGKTWLVLQTGLDGVGGACGNDDGSYAKILKTHTTTIKGSYLVREGTEAYVEDTMYAVGWITYNGTNKNWTIGMELNNQKAITSPGKVDVCDIGLGVFTGKNTVLSQSQGPGAVKFGYRSYDTGDNSETYATEAEAAAAINSPEAAKAYAILQSARYE